MLADYADLLNEVQLLGEAEGLLQAEAFFKLFADAASNSGDIEDAQYCPVIFEGRAPYRIDGYYLNRETGELGLIASDFRVGTEVQAIDAARVKQIFDHALRFFWSAQKASFLNELESTSYAAQAGYLIHEAASIITSVRVVIFSAARLTTRKSQLTSTTERGVRLTCSVLDLQRWIDIRASARGVDPIEIDLVELELAPLPCLLASDAADGHSSYLVVVPADTLAEIYGRFGARLLEANVRAFLQARTRVNSGIQATLRDEPQYFFAYNNGLTATASEVEIDNSGNGAPVITRIKDLQIVNGGQTTASILYARDRGGRTLDSVFVQMKLSVIREDLIDEVVPKISRFANSQNKVSDADFFSSHPFHLQIERLSRRHSAPLRDGAIVASKWFYERSRGQYRDAQSGLSAADKRKFLIEFPRHQFLDKTDLAKYEMAFEREPHIVSLGAQKCFAAFAEHMGRRWEKSQADINDDYFRVAIARAIIFRAVDRMIGESEWYKANRGYKSQVAAYTIALIAEFAHRRGAGLDLRTVWARQEPHAALMKFIANLAPHVATAIRRTPASNGNVGEFCKRASCWEQVKMSLAHHERELPEDILVRGSAA